MKNPMTDASNTGKMVRFHRKFAQLSQLELAKLSGVGKTAIFDIEHGKKTTRLETLLKILKSLNISIQFHSPLMHLFETELK
jgi:transcriptional regulator with XRE-family HTH domain